MLSSNQPTGVSVPFADSGDKRPIPIPSQVSITPGAASYTTGFPPKTMLPLASGGIPPDGFDFNGILNDITNIQKWQSAGGLFKYDAAFSTAVGGYPKGAMLIAADGSDRWFNTVESNVTDPDSVGNVGWVSYSNATGGATLIFGATQVVANITELRALSKTRPSAFANTAGYYAKGDGGDGQYYYDSSDTTTADNGGTVIVAADGGRWKLIHNDVVSVKQFGLKGDGATDNSAKWQIVLTYCATNNKALFVPDGVFLVNTKATINGLTVNFGILRIFGNGRATGPKLASNPSQCGPVIATTGGGALEVWFQQFSNEAIVIDGVSFYDTANFPSQGRAATPAIKIKKGDPSGSDRYITGLGFRNMATVGYADPIVFQGMYPNSGGYTYLSNFIGPTDFHHYYPYQCGSAIAIQNCTLNRLRISESLFFDLSLGGIVLRKDGDLTPGTGTGGSVMCALDMVHFEDVRGCFRLPASPPLPNKISLNDVSREVCGIVGGFPASGDPFGILGTTDLVISGRFDEGLAYGESNYISLPAGCSVSSQSPVTMNLPVGVQVWTPGTVNYLDQTFNIAATSTLVKKIAVALGTAIDFVCDVELSFASGSYGAQKIATYGRTGGTKYRDVSGQLNGAIVNTISDGTGTEILQISVNNASAFVIPVRIRVRTISGLQISIT